MHSKQNAQYRVDQINAFNSELNLLEQEGVLQLSDTDKSNLHNHHQQLLKSLSQTFDIDASTSQKQFSLAMKIASLIGALAFSASLFMLFYQYWGNLTTLVQTSVLISSPLIALALTQFCLVKEQSGYFAKIAGLVCVAAFVLNLSMLGQIYNIAPSPNAFIVWAIASLALAYMTNSRLLQTFAILFFAGFLSAKMGTWSGIYWLSFGERPENFFLPALIIFALGHKQQKGFEEFAAIYRIFGGLLFLLPVLVLANWARGSYLTIDPDLIEGSYQIVGFVISAALIYHGIRQNWRDLVNLGSTFFTLFLYTKMFDWWWDWMPKYLFFLVIALTALLILMVFKRLRTGEIGLWISTTKGAEHA